MPLEYLQGRLCIKELRLMIRQSNLHKAEKQTHRVRQTIVGILTKTKATLLFRLEPRIYTRPGEGFDFSVDFWSQTHNDHSS